MTKEKTNFILGLLTGVAVISLIGFMVISIAYFRKDGSNSLANIDSNQVVEKDEERPAPAPTLGKPVDIKVASSDHIRGDKDAPITIVEYSDFQCPYCSRFHDTMLQVMENYPDDVRWVYKHFPLDSIHPQARKAAEASECAGEQNKFWEYTDKLFENQSSLNTDYFGKAAKELNLDTNKFNSCLSSGKYASKVNSDSREGQQAGVTGTPGSFINGQALKGARPYSELAAMIDNLK